MEISKIVKTLNLAKMKTRPTVVCSQYKCVLKQYLVSCSIGVYLFVKDTSVLVFIASFIPGILSNKHLVVVLILVYSF